MLKLLIDTNVLIDVALKRGQAGIDGATLLDAIARGTAEGHVAPHCITTAYYIIAREIDDATARLAVAHILRVLSVVALGTDDFYTAVAIDMADFEDAVQSSAALAIGANYIASNNKKDFRRSPVPARNAAELLPLVMGSANH